MKKLILTRQPVDENILATLGREPNEKRDKFHCNISDITQPLDFGGNPDVDPDPGII